VVPVSSIRAAPGGAAVAEPAPAPAAPAAAGTEPGSSPAGRVGPPAPDRAGTAPAEELAAAGSSSPRAGVTQGPSAEAQGLRTLLDQMLLQQPGAAVGGSGGALVTARGRTKQ
jgi:hypothetical protein